MSNPIKNRLGKIRSRFTYANVLASVAIFAALGGGAFAATKAAKNSVVSKSIKNGQVKSQDVKDDSLTGVDINEGTLQLPSSSTPSGAAGGDLAGTYPNPTIKSDAVTSAKVAADSLTAGDLANDSVGSDEVAIDSVRGQELAVGFQLVDDVTASNSDDKTATATCPLGKRVVGGGGFVGGLGADIVGVTEQGPNGTGTQWIATGVELVDTASNWTVQATAICVDID